LAAAAGCFSRYLDRGPKELFFSDKLRSEDNFQTQNTTQKVQKSTLTILKTVKYCEFGFSGLSTKPEMYSSPTKLRKTKYKHRKTLASATCFDSNVPHIFSYSSKIYV
jgi:hypothetical protein